MIEGDCEQCDGKGTNRSFTEAGSATGAPNVHVNECHDCRGTGFESSASVTRAMIANMRELTKLMELKMYLIDEGL